MTDTEISPNEPCPCGSGKQYKDCCLGRDTSGPGAGHASDSRSALEQTLADRQFDTPEDMQAFVDQFMQQRNQVPLDDFHGLSPFRSGGRV